jgi:transcriptional regulator with XRE-family HTH domain
MSIEIRPKVIKTGFEFGPMLRAARLTAGINATALAAHLGISPGTVTTRENGSRQITVGDAVTTLALCGYVLAMIPATDVIE